jgi:hypothetical protein
MSERVVERVREIGVPAPPVAIPSPPSEPPALAPTAPRAPFAPMLAAPVPAPLEVPPAPPRLSIGRVVVEVVPRTTPAAAPQPVHTTIVIRSPPTAHAGILHRGFGLGQS